MKKDEEEVEETEAEEEVAEEKEEEKNEDIGDERFYIMVQSAECFEG